jgi:ABC-type antimicrobial peptide transport system permease subunit
VSLSDDFGLFEMPLIDPKIEELIIEGTIDGFLNENTFYTLLKSISSKIKKFHFINSNPMFGENFFNIINALSGEELNESNIKNLNINVFVFDEMLEAINNRLSSLEILYLNFKSYSNRRVSLKNLKNLRQINLNFNTTNHDFGLRADSENDNSLHLSKLLSHCIPSTVKKLSLSNAFISLTVFKEIKNYLPFLEVLELNYVCIEMDCGLNFWEVCISNKYSCV